MILSTNSGAVLSVESAVSMKDIIFSRSPSMIALAIFSRGVIIFVVSVPGITLACAEKCSIKCKASLSVAIRNPPLFLHSLIQYWRDLGLPIVKPQNCAIARNVALSQGRPGIPKDTLESPRMVLLLKVCAHQ